MVMTNVVMSAWNSTTVEEFILLGLTNKQHLQIVLLIVFLLCYIISLIGNIVIIWISSVNQRLNTPMYFFVRNLSFLDIWYTSSIIPKMLKDFLSVKKSISFIACFTQMFIHLSLGGAECFLLLIMAYDRYAAVCSPLHYTTIMHPVLCIRMAILSWVGGIANSILQTVLTLQLPFCGPHVINHFICEEPILLELACIDTSLNKMLIFICAIVIAVIPFFLILVTYIYIISSIMKISTSSGRGKAFSTCASHVIVVTLFYGTIFSMYLRPGAIHVANQDKMATLFYSVITPMLNPLIYTLRNKDVKESLKEILRKKNG